MGEVTVDLGSGPLRGGWEGSNKEGTYERESGSYKKP